MNRLEWAKQYHQSLKDELVKVGYYTNEKEANLGIVLHNDLHGEGPAITYDGDYEILGHEVMMHTTEGSFFITIEDLSNDFFAEPQNQECVRIYET